MVYSKLVNNVLGFIYKAHEGAVDKSGVPYVFHPLTVAMQMDDENSTLVALLHDVVEDTEYTFDDIVNLGVNDEVIEALKLLTHDKSVDYFEYLKVIKTNALATKVKLADLRHNSDLTRKPDLNEFDLIRQEKYKKAIEFLSPKENAEAINKRDNYFEELYNQVLETLHINETISISQLQRRFTIGYARAGSILDRLEKEGYITAYADSKYRKILKEKSEK